MENQAYLEMVYKGSTIGTKTGNDFRSFVADCINGVEYMKSNDENYNITMRKLEGFTKTRDEDISTAEKMAIIESLKYINFASSTKSKALLDFFK